MKVRGICLGLALVLTGCVCPTMDVCYFESIELGENIDTVVGCAGQPYWIKDCGDGRQEYRYQTRLRLSRGHHREHEFVLTVEDGVVVEKCSSAEEHDEMIWIDFDKEHLPR